jgi:CPA2 family monovalent cation:H+ antiporter-2
MLIDPALVAEHWLAVVVLTIVVVLGKIVGVTVGAFLTGNSTRTAVQAGMSLAQIGEFSFIIAGLGLSLGATGSFLYPVAVAVSAITTLTTPFLIRRSGAAASYVDRKLPRPLQTFAALYGSWLERMRTEPPRAHAVSRTRRAIRLLCLDATLFAAVVIVASLFGERLEEALAAALGLRGLPAHVAVLAVAVLLAFPFGVGVVRTARWLGRDLAERALPPTAGGLDLAAAPRRTLVVALQLGIVLVVGAPLVAIIEPFVPGAWAASVLLLVVFVLGIGFWRRAAELQGHVRAGAQAIVEALASQAHAREVLHEDEGLAQIHRLLPGIGEPVAVEVPDDSPAVGRTLAQLDVRGVTGATVLAIRRGEGGVIVPGAREALRAGDVLALAGTHDAVEAARTLLRGP